MRHFNLSLTLQIILHIFGSLFYHFNLFASFNPWDGSDWPLSTCPHKSEVHFWPYQLPQMLACHKFLGPPTP